MTLITAWDLRQAELEALLRLARSLRVRLSDIKPSTDSGRVALEQRVMVAIQLDGIRQRAAKRRAAA